MTLHEFALVAIGLVLGLMFAFLYGALVVSGRADDASRLWLVILHTDDATEVARAQAEREKGDRHD